MNDSRDNRPFGSEPSEYHIVRPEQDRSAYSDAYYRSVPREDEGSYGYNPSRYYADEDTEAHQGQFGMRGILALALTCVMVAGLLAVGGMYLLFRHRTAQQAAASSPVSANFYAEARQAQTEEDGDAPFTTAAADPAATPMAGEDIYGTACEQVVGVTTTGTMAGRTVTGSGSGIILSGDGYIITNYHVIETGAAAGWPISVVLHSGKRYDARVVGTESDSDIAVLKITAPNLAPALLGDSDALSVGSSIYAVGNPLGDLPYTMTTGIVSALDRRITTEENVMVNMFQFDAAVNSGNSGGPVYNAYGQVVGVVTAKYSAGGVEGLGFAIPIADAVHIANELITRGYVPGKAYLGLTLKTVTPVVAQYYHMVPGAYVDSVEAGSAADAAGLRVGDIITAVDGTAVASEDDMRAAVKGYKAGDAAKLTVYRSGVYRDISVTFAEAVPAETAQP